MSPLMGWRASLGRYRRPRSSPNSPWKVNFRALFVLGCATALGVPVLAVLSGSPGPRGLGTQPAGATTSPDYEAGAEGDVTFRDSSFLRASARQPVNGPTVVTAIIRGHVPAHSQAGVPGDASRSNGAALPLPSPYLEYGTVDQGVDYVAPGGTPLDAMGAGVVIAEGITGFGSNAPVLQITSGPLAGKTVYYGHSGPDLVPVGAHVSAGQQISTVGYGIVGISTGPHLEIGYYPLGPMDAGYVMMQTINELVGYST